MKRVRFSLISVFDVDKRACFVFISRREGKLVNISVSVDARMPILDMNTDQTRLERGINDVQNSQILQAKKPSRLFAIRCYKIAKNRDASLKSGISIVHAQSSNIQHVLTFLKILFFNRFSKHHILWNFKYQNQKKMKIRNVSFIELVILIVDTC